MKIETILALAGANDEINSALEGQKIVSFSICPGDDDHGPHIDLETEDFMLEVQTSQSTDTGFVLALFARREGAEDVEDSENEGHFACDIHTAAGGVQ